MRTDESVSEMKDRRDEMRGMGHVKSAAKF